MHEKEFREYIRRSCGEECYEEFKRIIREYCNIHAEKDEGILSTAFSNLWIQSKQEISPKDLATLTSRIINDLVKEGVLKEIPKPDGFDVLYGMYKILPHEMLIKDNKKY